MAEHIISPKQIYCDIKCVEEIPEPCSIVIFGATGDLAHRKIFPSLYNLFKDGLLPKGFSIVAAARTNISEANFKETIKSGLNRFLAKNDFNALICDNFLKKICYYQIDYANPQSYFGLSRFLQNNTVFYLSIPPIALPDIIKGIGISKIAKENGNGWKRIIIEKPFGNDLKTAKELNKTLLKFFKEQQIYHIDHYLGKETVQNLLMFRFANTIFEPLWNNKYIEHIQISSLETVGVEHRAAYYENTGALRDMFQNHMFQLLAFVAMEPPYTFNTKNICDAKDNTLKSVMPISIKDVVRGQYAHGEIDGNKVTGYRTENGVDKNSNTETYVAMKLMLNNKRWKGVPFYLRSGKRLAKKLIEIVIQFKPVPQQMFVKSILDENLSPNTLIFRLQPDEGISLSFLAKRPGAKLCTNIVNMDFSYKSVFGRPMPEAYQRLLLDCMLGDKMLFNCSETVELCWSLITPILEKWGKEKPKKFPNYKSGTWGPLEANKLL